MRSPAQHVLDLLRQRSAIGLTSDQVKTLGGFMRGQMIMHGAPGMGKTHSMSNAEIERERLIAQADDEARTLQQRTKKVRRNAPRRL